MTVKTTVPAIGFEPRQTRCRRFFAPGGHRYHGFTVRKGQHMKPSLNLNLNLNLKILILLGYVALCTMLVLLNQQGDVPAAFEYQGYQGFR
jgi:hypothetical protein